MEKRIAEKERAQISQPSQNNLSASQKELTISDVCEEIDRANKLADIANTTTDREEFYNSMEEIENILTELIKYELKFDFYYPPSADLVNLRNGKAEQIELLEKRITEKENIQPLAENDKNSENSTRTIKISSTTESIDCTEQSEKNKDTIVQNEENTQDINTDNQPPKDDQCPDNEESKTEALEDRQKREPYKYIFPPINLLNEIQKVERDEDARDEKLKQTFESFGISMDIVNISKEARYTRFEIQLGQGVRIRDVLRIKDDIQLNLAASNLSIEAPIAGKTTIGIDVENNNFSVVTLREIMESYEFQSSQSNLTVAIGKDIMGNVIVESIENMFHLLIAGTTGSGKSVCINSIIMSILYKANPSEVKFILIDTKVINFCIYNGIPHLMIPVITDLRKAPAALNWAVSEMNGRYQKFAKIAVRDLKAYNEAAETGKLSLFGDPIQKLPSIVIIIDDFADLMVGYNTEVRESVCRLAQMGRACGIHLIISTQRPSVDVITGIIKANIPSRIAFNVFSAVDSKIILDEKGAEKLLPDGDMLFRPQGSQKTLRVQGAYVSDSEILDVIDFLKFQMFDNI